MRLIDKILRWFRGTSVPLTTNWKIAPLAEYDIHNITSGESGEESGETYSYYLMIHPRGQKIIMRVNSSEDEIRFATGRWGNRTSLSYTTRDNL